MMRRIRALLCTVLVLVLCLSMMPLPAQAAAKKTLTVSFQAVTYQNRARTLLKQINGQRQDMFFLMLHGILLANQSLWNRSLV